MADRYVELDTLKIVSHKYLQTKYSKYTDFRFGDEQLAEMNAAWLDESATGDVRTGLAVKSGNVYYREYRPFTEQELSNSRRGELADTDRDMARVMEDMWLVLVTKGLVTDADLPQVSQDKLNNRRNKRLAL